MDVCRVVYISYRSLANPVRVFFIFTVKMDVCNNGNNGELTSLSKYRENGTNVDSGYGDSFCSTADASEFQVKESPIQECTPDEGELENVAEFETEFNNLNLNDKNEPTGETQVASPPQKNDRELRQLMDYIVKAFTPDEDNDT